LKEKYGFDKFYHLSMVATLQQKTTISVNGRPKRVPKQLAIEKLEVVSVNDNIEVGEGMETQDVPLAGKSFTIKDMFRDTRAKVGDTLFFSYSALGNNNCQNFIKMLLESQGLYREPEAQFVFQDLSQLVKELPQTTTAVSQGITHLGALANKYLGVGGAKNEIVIPKKDFVKEHKHLIGLLSSSDDPKLKKEAESQAKELKSKGGKKPCWKGYEQFGSKEKDGKSVPNCVPMGSGKVGLSDLYRMSGGGLSGGALSDEFRRKVLELYEEYSNKYAGKQLEYAIGRWLGLFLKRAMTPEEQTFYQYVAEHGKAPSPEPEEEYEDDFEPESPARVSTPPKALTPPRVSTPETEEDRMVREVMERPQEDQKEPPRPEERLGLRPAQSKGIHLPAIKKDKRGGNQSSGFIRAMMARDKASPEEKREYVSSKTGQTNAEKFEGLDRRGFKLQEMTKTTHDLARKKKALTRNQAIKRFYDYVIANAPQHQPLSSANPKRNYREAYDLDDMFDRWIEEEGVEIREQRRQRREAPQEEVFPMPEPQERRVVRRPQVAVVPDPPHSDTVFTFLRDNGMAELKRRLRGKTAQELVSFYRRQGGKTRENLRDIATAVGATHRRPPDARGPGAITSEGVAQNIVEKVAN
jgi:hypothetical protein